VRDEFEELEKVHAPRHLALGMFLEPKCPGLLWQDFERRPYRSVRPDLSLVFEWLMLSEYEARPLCDFPSTHRLWARQDRILTVIPGLRSLRWGREMRQHPFFPKGISDRDLKARLSTALSALLGLRFRSSDGVCSSPLHSSRRMELVDVSDGVLAVENAF
jgi:hypothetical protein